MPAGFHPNEFPMGLQNDVASLKVEVTSLKEGRDRDREDGEKRADKLEAKLDKLLWLIITTLGGVAGLLFQNLMSGKH